MNIIKKKQYRRLDKQSKRKQNFCSFNTKIILNYFFANITLTFSKHMLWSEHQTTVFDPYSIQNIKYSYYYRLCFTEIIVKMALLLFHTNNDVTKTTKSTGLNHVTHSFHFLWFDDMLLRTRLIAWMLLNNL